MIMALLYMLCSFKVGFRVVLVNSFFANFACGMVERGSGLYCSSLSSVVSPVQD